MDARRYDVTYFWLFAKFFVLYVSGQCDFK